MKKFNPFLRWFFTCAGLAAFGSFQIQTPAATVVIPNYLATNEIAFGSGTLNSVIREQEVFSSTEFPAGQLLIKELRFRPDTAFGHAFSTTISHLQINLSATSKNHDQLSATFANNVGANDTIVFNGPISIASQF